METPTLPRATPTDEALVAEAATGDTSAFALLVGRYAAPVLAVVERACGDHHLARDLTQEIWIKVHRGLAGFHADRRFRPWLFAIALNHARDALRKAGRRAQHIRSVRRRWRAFDGIGRDVEDAAELEQVGPSVAAGFDRATVDRFLQGLEVHVGRNDGLGVGAGLDEDSVAREWKVRWRQDDRLRVLQIHVLYFGEIANRSREALVHDPLARSASLSAPGALGR